MSRSIKAQNGGSLIELSLIIPVVFIIAISGFALTQTLRYYQLMSALSREAANDISRACIDSPTINTCVTAQYTQFNNFAIQTLPGVEVVVSVYNFNGGAPTREFIIGVQPGTEFTPSGNMTKFNTANVANDFSQSLNAQNTRLFFSEIFFNNPNPILSLFAQQDYYELSVFSS